jgi:hypothetical protein
VAASAGTARQSVAKNNIAKIVLIAVKLPNTQDQAGPADEQRRT